VCMAPHVSVIRDHEEVTSQMILRVWHGWASPENADEFEQVLREEIVPGIAAKTIPGYYGLDLLRKDDGELVQFTTQMWFASIEAVKAFAGDDYEKAVIHPDGGRLLKEYDQTSAHHEVRSLLAAWPPANGSSQTMLDLLAAPGPAPEWAEKLQLFGQFVGSWDADWTGYNEDGSTQTVVGEWHFGWALEGRAIIDVTIGPAMTRRAAGASLGEYGAAVRIYDPAIDAWRMTWNGAQSGTVRTFIGRQVGEEIVLEAQNVDRPMSWIFSEITKDSFHWRNEEHTDGGKPRLKEDMEVRRR
jgi:hypothetical protein